MIMDLADMHRDQSGYGSANERRRYIVMLSLIGWTHTSSVILW